MFNYLKLGILIKPKIRLKINVTGRGCLFRKNPAADKQYTEVVIIRILETLIYYSWCLEVPFPANPRLARVTKPLITLIYFYPSTRTPHYLKKKFKICSFVIIAKWLASKLLSQDCYTLEITAFKRSKSSSRPLYSDFIKHFQNDQRKSIITCLFHKYQMRHQYKYVYILYVQLHVRTLEQPRNFTPFHETVATSVHANIRCTLSLGN